MNKENCFQLGTIAKLHGYKGEVSLFMDVSDLSKYEDLDHIFIEINASLTPFFIERKKFKNKGFVALKLEGIDDEASAKKLLKKAVFLPDTFLECLDDQSFYDYEIIGYKVEDTKHGNIGVVKEVIDNASNPLLSIQLDDKELLIPIFDGLVQKVDRQEKVLTITSPEGLIELYR